MRLPILISCLGVLAVAIAAGVIAARRAATEAPVAGPAPIFALRAADGRAMTQDDLRGGMSLVYFGFTACPDVCPTELGWMVRVLRHLGPQGELVRPVFITLDPARDTPELLTAYASAFHPRLLALTGTEAEVQAAADAFGVVFRRQTPVSEQPGFYLIDHTMTTFVLAADGRIVHRLHSRDLDPAAAAALLRPLLAGGAP